MPCSSIGRYGITCSALTANVVNAGLRRSLVKSLTGINLTQGSSAVGAAVARRDMPYFPQIASHRQPLCALLAHCPSS
jgi:hypothetical protein